MMRLTLLALAFTFCAGSGLAQKDNLVLGKNAEDWLVILKDHKEFKWRRASLIALEVFGPRTRGVVPGVLGTLEKDTEPELRREAALLLGRMGGDAKEAVTPLSDALKKDKSDVVREAAALALAGKLNEFASEQVLVLAGALKDPHPGTRAAAAEALRNLGDKAQLAVPQLTSAAKDKKMERVVRLYAIQIVSRLHDDPAAKSELLLGILDEADAHVTLRVAALEGIGRRDLLTVPELTATAKVLKEKSVEMRRAAASVVAKHGTQSAEVWPAIQTGLKDEDNAVRYQLIRATGAIAVVQKEAVEALTTTAKQDAHVENRLAAIEELGQLGTTAATSVETLRKLAVEDARATVRDAATAALKKVQGM